MDRLAISNDAVEITLAKSDEVVIDTGVVEGEIATDGTISEEGMYTEEGMYAETGMPEMKDPLLSSWPFVIGISAAVFFVSVALGAFLAKRKIKKGIELYED
ncbi:MAG: hypothetical protein ACYDEX_00515 [Mobilitalea sp.]